MPELFNIDCGRAAKSLLPIASWLPKYSPPKLRQDIVAGLTVGLMVIPQGLAFAQIAELPVQYGLYSAFMGPFVYCLLGTSKDTTLGPTAIMSLLTATYNAAPGPSPKSTVYAVLMCFACGIVQFAMGILRLGSLVKFISLPVVSGFTTSAAVTIAWGQVKSLLGLKHISSSLPISVYQICRDIRQANCQDVILGVSCMAVLLLLMMIQKDIQAAADSDSRSGGDGRGVCVSASRTFLTIICSARNAIVVACAGLVAFALPGSQLSLTPPVQSGLPKFRVPDFQLTNGSQELRDFGQIASDIGIGFAVIPFIGLVETIAISRVFAQRGNYRIDASQELVAIGLANFAGSFFSSYPVTGSFSRTAINNQSGVKTPAGGIFTGIVVLLALAFLGDLFKFIPQSALAAIIILAVLRLMEFKMLLKLWSVRKTDCVEWLITFLVTVGTDIQFGILSGIAVSFVFLLYRFSKPGFETSTRPSGLAIVTVKTGVRFPAADDLELSLVNASNQSNAGDSRVCGVCADLSLVTEVDYAVIEALRRTSLQLHLTSCRLYVVAGQPDVLSTLQRAGLEVFQSLQSVESEFALTGGASEVTPLIS